MKQCPVCEVPLTRMPYESVYLFKCNDCSGYLVSENQSNAIRRNLNTSEKVLKMEVEFEGGLDTRGKLKCPTCYLPMEKYSRPGSDFKIDVCGPCKQMWYDGGELAQMQLDYEDSPTGQEARRMKENMEDMSDEERHALDQKIRALPKAKGFFAGLFAEMFEDRQHNGWN